jgi:hypothetical protein
MPLECNLTVQMAPVYTTTGVGEDAIYRPIFNETLRFASGTGANEADRLIVTQLAFNPVSETAGNTITLSADDTSVLGAQGTIAELVGFVMINEQADGTANTLSYQFAGGDNPFAGLIVSGFSALIEPGGFVSIVSPTGAGLGAAVAATSDEITIRSNSGTANDKVQVVLIGRSA